MQLTKEDMTNAAEAIMEQVERLRQESLNLDKYGAAAPNQKVWYDEQVAYLTALAQQIKKMGGLQRKYDVLLDRYNGLDQRSKALIGRAEELSRRISALEQQANQPKEQK